MLKRFVYPTLALLTALPALGANNKLTVDFPKPDPEQALPFMKVYGADGHPWRVPVEDIAGAKARIAQDPGWAKWVKAEGKALDQWAAHEEDHVDWDCGWYHDFVSPKDASHLTYTDEVPGRDVPFLHSPSDPEVPITPKIMAAWVFAFRSKHAGMIQRAARLYRLTGDQHYADWAISQLDFYSDNYLKFTKRPDGSRLWWQTLDVAVFMITYADSVRLLGDAVTPEHRANWKKTFFDPQVEVLNAHMLQIHNIANWHRCAVASVALVFGDEALWKQALDGPWGFRKQMAQGITSDYLWCEQSMGYTDYVVEGGSRMLTLAGLYGKFGQVTVEASELEDLMLEPTYLRFPDGRLPNPADSGEAIKAPARGTFESVYRIFPTTVGLKEVAGKRSWDTLVDPAPPSPRPAALPPVGSANLATSQMAILKSTGWQVYLHYGQWTASHSQAEALNFEATYNGVDITHDTGTVGYGSPMHKGYYTRGADHNVPLVDGEGEVPPELGKVLSYSADPAEIEAAVPKYRPDSEASRELHFDGESLVDVAKIKTTDGKDHVLGLTFSPQGKAKLGSEFSADTSITDGRPTPFTYWRNVTQAKAHDTLTVDVDYGSIVMHVTFATKGDFTIWHGSTPDHPPHRRETFYLETKGPAEEFRTTLSPQKN